MATLTPGVNTWATLAEANEYFSSWYGRPSTVWATLADSDKTALLITAYNDINSLSNIDIPADSTDSRVFEAQYRYAWWYYDNGDDSQKRGGLIDQGVTEFKTLDFMEKYGKAEEMPSKISDLLEDYKKANGSGFAEVRREGLSGSCE
jgi:hypothetical protein